MSIYSIVDALIYNTAYLAPRVPKIQNPANGDEALMESSYTISELFSDYSCTQRIGNISFRNVVFKRGEGDYDTMTYEGGFVSINQGTDVYSFIYESLLTGSQRVFTSNSYSFATAPIMNNNNALFVNNTNVPLTGKYTVSIDDQKIRTISLTTDDPNFALNGKEFYYSLPYVTDDALIMTYNSNNVNISLGENA